MNPLMPVAADATFSAFIIIYFGIAVWSLVDLWKSKAEQNTKLLWTLVVVILNPIGGIIWFAAGRKANK
ncbi:MAG: hypothetical protein RL166_584 [Actinomycetota bacterium]|jgi:hypothetical protein